MADQGSLRLALTGDSMITRVALAPRDESVVELVALIRGADVAFTNLEVLPNDFRGYPAVESGGTHLAAHRGVLDHLIDMGFNLFSCANNHALDYSIEGLLATIEVLEDNGVAFAGVGHTLTQARMPVYLDHEGVSVAMISCSSTFAKGQSAGEQRPEVQGRPGLNPLRFDVTYEVTSEQLETLRGIADALGLERQRQEWIQLGFAFPPKDPSLFPLADTNLRSAGLLNARFRGADRPAVKTVPNPQDMEEVLKWTREARLRADVVLVSLHAHEHFKVEPHKTPAELFQIRHQNDEKGFPADKRFWQTVVPICSFENGRLQRIEVIPVTLDHGRPVHHRGRPRLVGGEEAQEILARFARLSEVFGTRVGRDERDEPPHATIQ